MRRSIADLRRIPRVAGRSSSGHADWSPREREGQAPARQLLLRSRARSVRGSEHRRRQPCPWLRAAWRSPLVILEMPRRETRTA